MGRGGANGDEEDIENKENAVICREARCTLDQQIEKIHQSDQKAIALFRSNLVLLGILITALSLTVRVDEIPTAELVNAHTGFGTALILISTFLVGIAYLSSSFKIGIGPGIIENRNDPDESLGENVIEEIQIRYKRWMSYNQHVDQYNSYLITFSIIAVIDGIIFLISGILIGLFEWKFSWISIAILGGLVIFLIITDFVMYYAEGIFVEIYSESD